MNATVAAAALGVVAAGGCAHRPALDTYRMLNAGGRTVLAPPGVADARLARRVLTLDVAAGMGNCARQTGAVTLESRKKKVRATIDAAALERQAAGWLAAWSARLEAQGCVAPGNGARLARRIAESAPLGPETAYRLLQPPIASGYVELGPENTLEVRSPIPREGAPETEATIANLSGTGSQVNVDLRAAPGMLGFEIAWYGIVRSGQALRFVPLSAERHLGGAVEHAAGPATNYFQFPPRAAFYRLFYKADDNGVTAVVAAGTSAEDLEVRSEAVRKGIANCARQSGMCIALPRHVGINPFLSVEVNGSRATVPLGATVAQAIRAAGARQPETVLGSLRVTRLYRERPTAVQFDRQSQAILGLRLVGGETISWR